MDFVGTMRRERVQRKGVSDAISRADGIPLERLPKNLTQAGEDMVEVLAQMQCRLEGAERQPRVCCSDLNRRVNEPPENGVKEKARTGPLGCPVHDAESPELPQERGAKFQAARK